MGRGVNSCHFIGNLGRDPETRYSQAGNAITNFSLAVGDRRKVDGEWQEPKHGRDHLFDCEVMQLVLARHDQLIN